MSRRVKIVEISTKDDEVFPSLPLQTSASAKTFFVNIYLVIESPLQLQIIYEFLVFLKYQVVKVSPGGLHLGANWE